MGKLKTTVLGTISALQIAAIGCVWADEAVTASEELQTTAENVNPISYQDETIAQQSYQQTPDDFYYTKWEEPEIYTVWETGNSGFGYQFFGNTKRGIIINGELLYFQPTIDQPYYAISSSRNFFGENIYPDGKRYKNQTGYKPGVRVEAIYDLCDCANEIDLRFAYLTAGHCHSVSGTFLFDTNGLPGNGGQTPEDTTYNGIARNHEHYKYYAGDATLNRLTCTGCYDNFVFLAGLHYAYIQRNEHSYSTGTFTDDNVLTTIVNDLHNKSHFWGIGPQLGIDYKYQLSPFRCFKGDLSFNMNARASLLCSHTKASVHYVTATRTGPRGDNITNEALWRVTPALDARVSLTYKLWECSHLEFGYELLWYSKSIDTIRGVDVAYAGDTIDIYSDLSLQGPFVAIGVEF